MPPDRDQDKIPDALDACPSLKGRANSDPTRNGCPADYDRDGVPDSEDACPNQKGVASAEPHRNGCPGELDTDPLPEPVPESSVIEPGTARR